jgi:integrase
MPKTLSLTASNQLNLEEAKNFAEQVFSKQDVKDETIKDDKYRIGLFLEFIKKQGFSNDALLDYKRFLSDKTDYTIATKKKYFYTAKKFLAELHRQGILPVDITKNIKGFADSRKHKKEGLNNDEIILLQDKMSQLPASPDNTRLKAILSLLALQGLRQVEITRLDVKDIDFVNKTAMIQGKGQDDKELVYLHPFTVKVLKDYLKTNNIADGALFTSRSNNSKNQRLTTRAVRGLVKKVLLELGIDKTTHGFRHYFTTTLIKTYKGDLLEVARYTRHRSLETLQVYNDNIKLKADLPRFYQTFRGVKF